MEANNIRFQEKYAKMEAEEVRYEEIQCDDAEYILVAFGSSSRICQKSVDLAAIVDKAKNGDCVAVFFHIMLQHLQKYGYAQGHPLVGPTASISTGVGGA